MADTIDPNALARMAAAQIKWPRFYSTQFEDGHIVWSEPSQSEDSPMGLLTTLCTCSDKVFHRSRESNNCKHLLQWQELRIENWNRRLAMRDEIRQRIDGS